MARRLGARFDAIVAGGGPAGAAVALALAHGGWGVLLLDARRVGTRTFKIGEVLPGGVRPILRDLGIWDDFVNDGHLPSAGTSAAWGAADPQDADSILDPHGHGWHLDRIRFERFLRGAAGAAGVDTRDEVAAHVAGRSRSGMWRIRLGGGGSAEVRSRTFVDASGRPAALARRLGAARRRHDRLVAVFASVRASAVDADARTLVEAVPGGWWYTALVPGGRRVVAFLTDADLVPARVRRPDGFLAALADTAHITSRVVSARLEFGPQTSPAHGSWLEPPAGDGWIAVGDAALACDPLSSQGLLNALFTGIEGGRALDAHLRDDRGALGAYRRRLSDIRAAYERNRLSAYALEDRWLEQPFWARRRGLAPSVIA